MIRITHYAVYTPQLPGSDNSSLFPVIVFIPGGGFDVGTGDSKLYGPNHLLDADVVLVVMNYRLGPLGFFSTGDEVAPGNWGLKDQVLALQWVQKNIAYFGADPDQVTIFRQSAGGASVQLLGLSDSTIVENRYPLLMWGPTDEPDIEGALLTDTPANLYATGKIRDLPSITGTDPDESVMFMPGILADSGTFDDFLDNFDDLLPDVVQYRNQVKDVPSVTAAIKKFYFNNDLTTNRSQVWHNCVKLLSDAFFIYPAYNALQKQFAFAKNAPFFYSFEYRGTYNPGDLYQNDDVLNTTAVHGSELLYLFPQLDSRFGVLSKEMSETDLRMIDTMVQLWTSFAINGTPMTTATISNTTWMAYSSEDNYLRIGSGSDETLDLEENFLKDRMQFWNNLISTGSGHRPTISLLSGFSVVFLLAYPIFGDIFSFFT